MKDAGKKPIVEGADTFVRVHNVTRMTGMSRSKIYLLMRAGMFPQPIKLGTSTNAPIAWSLRELEAWQRDQLAKRPGK